MQNLQERRMETSWADEEKLDHSDNTVENVITTAREGNRAFLKQNWHMTCNYSLRKENLFSTKNLHLNFCRHLLVNIQKPEV